MSENGRLKDSELALTLLGGRLEHGAADAADRMFTKFALDGLGVLQAVSAGDLYRDYATQVLRRQQVGNLAAIPGTSNHGWGIAGDLSNGMDSWDSSAQVWFGKNGRDFGWFTPGWANPASSQYQKNEPWHKEYDGDLDKHQGPKIRRPNKGEVGIGSTGPTAERAQILLNQALRGPNLVVDARFGLASAVAAARYQRSVGLAVSGVVGPITLAWLEGKRQPVEPPKPAVIYLQQGTKKTDQVENLQRFLRRLVPGLIIDGDYGPATEAAVKIWQEKAGMEPTGKIGVASKARLDELGVDL